MAEIINLNRHRKARAGEDKRKEAAHNRALAQLTPAERLIFRGDAKRAREEIERKRMDSDDPKDGAPKRK
jgi:Domain of unknown function (DUF4169)